jgi:head-tail adaptor
VRLPTAGELDRPVRIEYKVIANTGAHGTPVETWYPLVVLPGSPAVAATLWAQILDDLPSRSESVQQGAQIGRSLSRVRMRWRDDVTSDMRIVETDGLERVLQIIGGPAELGRREFFEVRCERDSRATAEAPTFPPVGGSASLATIYGEGVPVDGPSGTGAGNSAPGRFYIDQSGSEVYINQSQDPASPSWKLVPREA